MSNFRLLNNCEQNLNFIFNFRVLKYIFLNFINFFEGSGRVLISVSKKQYYKESSLDPPTLKVMLNFVFAVI